MWILKDIFLVVWMVIMTLLLFANVIGVGFDIQQMRENIAVWNLTWFEFLSLALSISFFVVVSKLIWKINRYEKAKPVLHNKKSLFDAMAGVKMAVGKVIGNIPELKRKRQGNTVFPPGRWEELDGIDNQFNIAYESLQKQIFTAGSVFESILKALDLCLQNAIALDPSAIGQLEGLITEARDKIDEISQPILDKEGSPTE